MLDELEQIRLGLLLGQIPRARLEQLAQMVRARREQLDDPKLIAILDEIELRAAVELAKLSGPSRPMTFDLSNHYNGMNDEFGTCSGIANLYSPGQSRDGL